MREKRALLQLSVGAVSAAEQLVSVWWLESQPVVEFELADARQRAFGIAAFVAGSCTRVVSYTDAAAGAAPVAACIADLRLAPRRQLFARTAAVAAAVAHEWQRAGHTCPKRQRRPDRTDGAYEVLVGVGVKRHVAAALTTHLSVQLFADSSPSLPVPAKDVAVHSAKRTAAAVAAGVVVVNDVARSPARNSYAAVLARPSVPVRRTYPPNIRSKTPPVCPQSDPGAP